MHNTCAEILKIKKSSYKTNHSTFDIHDFVGNISFGEMLGKIAMWPKKKEIMKFH